LKIGIVISSNDVETCWKALRYANSCFEQKDETRVFLIGKGIEYKKISTEKFNTIEEADKFLKSGGQIIICGIHIESYNQESSEMFPLLTMKYMYQIAKESDKVVTF
jgi:uncharacterized protein involved in oxidation of intracellular sulfur